MDNSPTIRAEIGPTLKLAIPIMLGMLGYGLMFVVDVAMAGHLGETALEVNLITRSTAQSRVGDGWFSRAYEVCMDVTVPAGVTELPLSVVFRDRDAGGDTVLASAPMEDGHPTGVLRGIR